MFSSYFTTMLSRKPSSGKVLPELDGLRGFAVLIVVASHCNFLSLRGVGGMGVWLFFVLSGFLLTKILVESLPRSLAPRNLVRYVVRRVARILPLYYFVLGCVALWKGYDFEWLYLHMTFQRAQGHFWSIPQEELFYLLLPIMATLVLVCSRLSRMSRLLPALGLWAVVVWFHPVLRLHGNGTLLSFALNVFLIGFVLAHLWQEKRFKAFVRSRAWTRSFNAASVPVLALMLLTGPAATAWLREQGIPAVALAWKYTTISGLLCAALLLIVLKPSTVAHRLVTSLPMRLVGVMSFSIYLIHLFVMEVLLREGGLRPGTLLFAATVACSLAIGLALERWLERPSIALGKMINRRIGSSPTVAPRSTPDVAAHEETAP